MFYKKETGREHKKRARKHGKKRKGTFLKKKQEENFLKTWKETPRKERKESFYK